MIDYSAVKAPLSDELVCGPDLEEEADDEFLNYVAAAEGRLPASFFAFARDSIDLKTELQTLSGLLARTRDIRLLVLTAKLSILAGDLVEFANAVEAIDYFLEHHWADVHPRESDGDFALRKVQIESLDEMPSVTLPLQYAPLVRDRRHGVISLRSQLIATGEVQPREGEAMLDPGTIHEVLLKTEDLDVLKSRYDAVCRLEQSLKSIPERFKEGTDYNESLAFERLPLLVHKIRDLLEGPLGERDPAATTPLPEAAAPADGSAAGSVAMGAEALAGAPAGSDAPGAEAAVYIRLESLDETVNALKAAESYFAGQEPSNPCILLIRQAQQLVGKSFIEAMQLLVPGRMETATVQLGGSQALAIPINQLGPFAAVNGAAGEAGNGAGGAGEPKVLSAGSRLEAVDLIAAAERYFVEFEPSSPVPLLLARARTYVNRDFFSLLNEFAPPPPPQ